MASTSISTYNGPVETINQFLLDHKAGIQDGSLPDELLRTTVYMDREPQVRRLSDFLERKLEKGEFGRPAIVVVPAQSADIPGFFVHRFQTDEMSKLLQRYLGKEHHHAHLTRCNWPNGQRDVKWILRSLTGQLGLDKVASTQEIESVLMKRPSSISFSHHISRMKWNDRNKRLFNEWLSYLDRKWPIGGERRILVSFVCFEVEPSWIGRGRSLKVFLRELQRRAKSDDRLCVLEPLQVIDAGDFGDWKGLVQESCANLVSIETLEAAAAETPFGKIRNPRLQRILPFMVEVLKSASVTSGPLVEAR